MSKTLIITQDEEKPVPKEVLAKAIVDIGAAMKHLRESGVGMSKVSMSNLYHRFNRLEIIISHCD
jgi:hypothetical protein